MTKATLWKCASVALGVALAGVAVLLPPDFKALSDVLLVKAGALVGGGLIRRPGDVKVD